MLVDTALEVTEVKPWVTNWKQQGGCSIVNFAYILHLEHSFV